MTARIAMDKGGGPVVGSITLTGAEVNTPITLSNDNDTGVLGWKWEMVDAPEPSASYNPLPSDVFTATTIVTPDVKGHTILMRLTTYKDAARTIIDDVDQQLIRVRFDPALDWVIPAAGETVQANAIRGWARDVNEILRELQAFAAAGGLALTPPTSPGDDGKIPVAASGDFTYLAGSAEHDTLTWNGSAWVSRNTRTMKVDAVGDTESFGGTLVNGTAATVGAQVQRSPGLLFSGAGWDTDGLNTVAAEAAIQGQAVAGVNVEHRLRFMERIAGGAWNLMATLGLVAGVSTLDLQQGDVISGASRVDDGGTAAYFEAAAGSTAGVSAANEGRLRYNQSTQAWEASANGGAYSALSTTATITWAAALANGATTDNTGANNPTIAANDALELDAGAYIDFAGGSIGSGQIRVLRSPAGGAILVTETSGGADTVLLNFDASNNLEVFGGASGDLELFGSAVVMENGIVETASGDLRLRRITTNRITLTGTITQINGASIPLEVESGIVRSITGTDLTLSRGATVGVVYDGTDWDFQSNNLVTTGTLDVDGFQSGIGGVVDVKDGFPFRAITLGVGDVENADVLLLNTTAATGGATVQRSPGLVLTGAAWDTDDTVSRQMDVMLQATGVSGTTPYPRLIMATRVDAGAWSNVLYASRNAAGTSFLTFPVGDVAIGPEDLTDASGTSVLVTAADSTGAANDGGALILSSGEPGAGGTAGTVTVRIGDSTIATVWSSTLADFQALNVATTGYVSIDDAAGDVASGSIRLGDGWSIRGTNNNGGEIDILTMNGSGGSATLRLGQTIAQFGTTQIMGPNEVELATSGSVRMRVQDTLTISENNLRLDTGILRTDTGVDLELRFGSGTTGAIYDGTDWDFQANNLVTTGIETITHDALAETFDDAIRLVNNTAATAGTQQFSPALEFEGQGWTGATIELQMALYLRTDTASGIQFAANVGGAGYADVFRIGPGGSLVWNEAADATLSHTDKTDSTDGGNITLAAQGSNDGDGGSIILVAADGTGTNKDGGSVNLVIGDSTGSGTLGVFTVTKTGRTFFIAGGTSGNNIFDVDTGDLHDFRVNGSPIAQISSTGVELQTSTLSWANGLGTDRTIDTGANQDLVVVHNSATEVIRMDGGSGSITILIGDGETDALVRFAKELATPTIDVEQQAGTAAGKSLTVKAGNANTSGAGGPLNLQGGAEAGGAGHGPVNLVDGGGTTCVQVTSAGEFNYKAALGVALGAGSPATLGNIGGSGPTSAGQAQWLQIEIGGTTHWLPAWT